MSISSVAVTSRTSGASSGYHSMKVASGARSPSSSVCSFAGSTSSEVVYPNNKYLMKTLCLSKRSPSLPGKMEYSNLLTCGLGARKWLASLDFDADSFRAAILNIYPRLSTVPSYSLWNVKPDKSFEKLPGSVNTPKRIKAYLGPTFTGSLVIMPSDEISMGPVKVPMARNFSSLSSSSSRSCLNVSNKEEKESSSSYSDYQNCHSLSASSVKYEKESGYESYQESISSLDQKLYAKPNPHKSLHSSVPSTSGGASGRSTRCICLTCGRLGKQVGSMTFYDINSPTTMATSDGYVSISKKMKDLFHIELPRSKIIPSDQICRKCFRALNEIHFLETQLKRSKEELMATFFSTVAKISRLEQMAREASGSSSSDNSTSSLFTLSPWIQEARYALDQQRAAVAAVRLGRSSSNMKQEPQQQQQQQPQSDSPTKTTVASVIFKGQNEGHYVDYRSPQPVFLAPLAGLANPGGRNDGTQGKADYDKHDSIYAKRSLVPMGLLTAASDAAGGGQAKTAPIFFTTSPTASEVIQERNQEIEEQMAAEAEAEAKEAEERAEVAAVALLENAFRKKAGSGSSRSSSIIGNNSSSPDSQSPSPPATEVMKNVQESSKSNNTSSEDLRRPWKKRYHEVAAQEADDLEKKRPRNADPDKRSKCGDHGSSSTNTDSGPVSSSGSSGSTNEEEDLTSSDASVSPKASSTKQ